MVIRIDEKLELSRTELHALLRGKTLQWRSKDEASGSQVTVKLGIHIGSEVTRGEKQAALDALTNDVVSMYRGGFAINPRGEAMPVPGTTAWLSYIATNSDRILWKGRSLADQSAKDQKEAIEAWLHQETVPSIVRLPGFAITPPPDGSKQANGVIPVGVLGGEEGVACKASDAGASGPPGAFLAHVMDQQEADEKIRAGLLTPDEAKVALAWEDELPPGTSDASLARMCNCGHRWGVHRMLSKSCSECDCKSFHSDAPKRAAAEDDAPKELHPFAGMEGTPGVYTGVTDTMGKSPPKRVPVLDDYEHGLPPGYSRDEDGNIVYVGSE